MRYTLSHEGFLKFSLESISLGKNVMTSASQDVFLAKNGFLGMACTLKALGRGRIITQGLKHDTNIILRKALCVT